MRRWSTGISGQNSMKMFQKEAFWTHTAHETQTRQCRSNMSQVFCYCIFLHMFSETDCLAIIWGSFLPGHYVVNRCGEDKEELTRTLGHQDKEQRRSDYNAWREHDAILCSGSHHSATSITTWNCSMLLSRKELYDILFSLTHLKSFSSSVALYRYMPLNCMKCIY